MGTLTKEIPNQMVSGSEMTERDLFLMMIDSLGRASNCARGMAQSRKDMRWLAVYKILDETQENVKRLMTKPKGLILLR